MLTLPQYREVRLYRPPPPPRPDYTTFYFRTALECFFLLLIFLLCIPALLPRPESDFTRRHLEPRTFVPPVTYDGETAVIPGKVQFLVHDEESDRLILDTGLVPPQLWETATGQRVASLVEQSHGLGAVAFSPNRKQLFTANRTRTGWSPSQVRIWDLDTGKLNKSITIPPPPHESPIYWQFQWLDDNRVRCTVVTMPIGGHITDAWRKTHWCLDTVNGKLEPYDLATHGAATVYPITKPIWQLTSGQFGKCNVWSSNDQTRITCARDP